MLTVIRSPSPRALEKELVASILEHKRGNPFAPDLIVVPRGSLRRYLMRRLPDLAGHTLLNARVVTVFELFYRFIHRFKLPTTVAEPDAERFMVRIALQRMALQDEESLLGYNEIEGIFYRVLRELFEAELDEDTAALMLEQMDELAPNMNQRTRQELTAILRVFLEWLGIRAEASLYTPLDRVKDITQAIERSDWQADPEELLHLYGFLEYSSLYESFFKSLCSRSEAHYYLPAASRADTDFSFTQRLLDERLQLLSPAIRDSAEHAAPSLHCFNTSGLRDEVREVAVRIRAVLEAPQPPALYRIGVIARDLTPYLPEITHIFEEHRIPFWTTARLSAGFDPVSRQVQSVVECLEHDFPRVAVEDILHYPNIDLPEKLAAFRFELIYAARAFGIVSGDDWERLENAALCGAGIKLPYQTEDEDDGEEPSGATVGAEIVLGFGAWIRELRALCRSWPRSASWSEHGRFLVQLLTQLAGFPLEPDDDPARRSESLVVKIIQSLGNWDEFQHEVERSTFLNFFRRRLHSLAPRPGGSDGVTVVTADEAVGMTFEVGFVLGLTRHAFPRQQRENAIMTEELRHACRTVLPRLASAEDRHAYERLLFRLLMEASAARLELSYTRSNEEGKPLSPSIYLQQLWYLNRLPPAESLPRNAKERLSAIRERHSLTAFTPGELFEYGALVLGNQGFSELAAAPASLHALRYRALPELPDLLSLQTAAAYLDSTQHLTIMDRLPPSFELLQARVNALLQNKLWATAIETLVKCPYRFFLSELLGINALEEPAPWHISALDEGTLVHKILELLVREEIQTSRRGDLGQIAELVFARFAACHATGLKSLWNFVTQGMVNYLAAFIAGYETQRQEEGWNMRAAEEYRDCELQFGDNLRLRLAARIDRIESHPDSETDRQRMLDYKTGNKPSGSLAGHLLRGTRLQPAIYLLLMEAAGSLILELQDPQTLNGQAGFLFVKDDENPLLEISGEDWLGGGDGYSVRRHVLRLLRLAVELLQQGLPLIRPGQNCTYCSVSPACRRLEFAARFRRERDPAPVVKLFLELAESAKGYLVIQAERLDREYSELFHD